MPNTALKTAQIKDSSVTLAKLANGTPGSVIGYSAITGAPLAIPGGVSGDYLRSNGTSTASFNPLPVASTSVQGIISIATAIEVQAATVTDKAVVPSTLFQNAGVMNGVAVIRGTGIVVAVNGKNVTSITDLGIGSWRVNWSITFAGASNYGIWVCAGGPVGGNNDYASVTATTATGTIVGTYTSAGVAEDSDRIYVCASAISVI